MADLSVVLITPLLLLLLQPLCEPTGVSGQSPCPQYFTYGIDTTTNEVIGQIQIPSPPKNVDLTLKAGLSIPVALPSKYVGRLELAQSKQESVRAIQQGGPILYRIYFPLRRPIPMLTGLWFNEQLYCSGPSATGVIMTDITLEHTLFVPRTVPLSQDNNAQPSLINYGPQFTLPQVPTVGPFFTLPTVPSSRPNKPTGSNKRPPGQRPIRTTTEKIGLSDGIGANIFLNPKPASNDRNDCGRSSNMNNINPLISKGMKTSPGQWPWIVALFVVKIEFEFQCAGSVLTNRHVITAAHCFKLDAQVNVNIPPSAMLVSLGRYRLRDWRELGSVNREIHSYTIHPQYTHEGTGDSDLAVLILRTPVEFSATIKPICLWSGSPNLQGVINKTGYVVGWGRDEFGNPYLAEPRMARVPIASQEECLWSDPQFIAFTSNRTFCAGSRDGSGPCNGDSGSGLVLYDSASGRYQLRGIVSRSLYDRDEMTCDLSQYVVFVDVAKYIDWINEQLSK